MSFNFRYLAKTALRVAVVLLVIIFLYLGVSTVRQYILNRALQRQQAVLAYNYGSLLSLQSALGELGSINAGQVDFSQRRQELLEVINKYNQIDVKPSKLFQKDSSFTIDPLNAHIHQIVSDHKVLHEEQQLWVKTLLHFNIISKDLFGYQPKLDLGLDAHQAQTIAQRANAANEALGRLRLKLQSTSGLQLELISSILDNTRSSLVELRQAALANDALALANAQEDVYRQFDTMRASAFQAEQDYLRSKTGLQLEQSRKSILLNYQKLLKQIMDSKTQ
jgi:hypothetical protein